MVAAKPVQVGGPLTDSITKDETKYGDCTTSCVEDDFLGVWNVRVEKGSTICNTLTYTVAAWAKQPGILQFTETCNGNPKTFFGVRRPGNSYSYALEVKFNVNKPFLPMVVFRTILKTDKKTIISVQQPLYHDVEVENYNALYTNNMWVKAVSRDVNKAQ